MLIRSKFGFSILEVVFALFIMGFSGFVATKMYTQSFKVSKETEVQGQYPELQKKLQSHAASFLSHKIVNPDGTIGANSRFCQFLTYTDVEYGTTDIRISLDKESFNKSYSPTEWEGIAKSFSKVKTTNCGKPEEKPMQSHCLEFLEEKDSHGELLSGRFDIYLKRLKRGGKKPFVNQAGGVKAVDAKEVLIEYSTSIMTNKGVPLSERRGIFWLSDMGTCEINGKKIEVSATGPGDLKGEKIYNTTQFMIDTPPDPFEMNVQRLSVQEGLALKDGSLVSNEEKNVAVSCTENKYRCPNSSKSREFDPTINFTADLNYIGDPEKLNSPMVTLKPKIEISNGSNKFEFKNAGVDVFLGGETYIGGEDGLHYLREVATSRKVSTEIYQTSSGDRVLGEFTEETYKQNKEKPLKMSKGSTSLYLKLNEVAPLCKKVCESSNAKYFPKFLLEVAEANGFSQAFEVGSPLGCTVCYMKSCGQLGLGTFGPKNNQPYEPLDGQLPECVLEDDSNFSLSMPSTNLGTISNKAAKQCVAAKLNSSKNGLVLEAKNCDQKLPVLCYGYGNFFASFKNTETSKDFVESDFSEAQRTCYEMSLESVRPEKIREMFGQYQEVVSDGLEPFLEMLKANPTTINSIEMGQYYNNAYQSIFLAPQTNEQVRSMIQHIKSEQTSLGEKFFWLNLKVEDSLAVYAAAPQHVNKNKINEQFAFYFTDTGLPYIMRDKSNLDSELKEGALDAAVLIHGIRHRGVKAVDQNQGLSLPVLCQRQSKPYRFFMTKEKVRKVKDAYGVCKSNNGSFVMPTTPLQWAQSMQEVNPHGEMISFPDPRENVKVAAWIALKTESTGLIWSVPSNLLNMVSSSKGLGTFHIKSDFSIFTGDLSEISQYKICINKDKQLVDLIDKGSSCSPGYFKLTRDFLSSWYYQMKIYTAILKKGMGADAVIEIE